MMTWLVDGEPQVLSIADREKSVEIPNAIPHVSRCAYPSRLIDAVYEDARAILTKVAKYVGMTSGPLSMQFFTNLKKAFRFVSVQAAYLVMSTS